MKMLIEQRDKLLKEIEALRHKVEGLEMAMGLIGGQNDEASTLRAGGKRRSNVKGLIIGLLTEAGTSGLNAISTVERASRKGVILPRPTASSILSRLKADGVAVYDGNVYRLKEFSNNMSDLIA
jgi:DNA-binding PadR family transcriptional regulator